MARTNFENLRVYQLSEEISDLIWEIVVRWKRLAQDTVGKQLIKAADSIGANEVSKLQNLINELTPKLSAYIHSIGNRNKKSDKKK
jgi:enoyl-[acyl-carrier-protein] reductase (NADH)